jgi:hypothetical protein
VARVDRAVLVPVVVVSVLVVTVLVGHAAQ